MLYNKMKISSQWWDTSLALENMHEILRIIRYNCAPWRKEKGMEASSDWLLSVIPYKSYFQ